ncbi:CPBP family intramembrane glutamic endopeptidase [Gillisia marina]|uniref:CPBP family intramembrane glutamic endopeptidase n=1 Tax=Gillisia marina TaxID=1167637 RepID=UPI001ED911A3|nr:type II CAAX endopeptidase family protein [Gillisia marina]
MKVFKIKLGLLKFDWKFGLVLILLFGIPRFLFVLEANRTGNYNFTSLIFLLMWITPFILLTKQGRRKIGIKKPEKYIWLVYSSLLGIVICAIVFFIGQVLYDTSISNWFNYISNSYTIPAKNLEGSGRHIYFAIFAFIGMTFSPIGEELLYRGLIHESFVPKFGENTASVIDSLAFATVHLAHFGLIYSSGSLRLLFIPAILWMLLMFFTSRLFFYCKKRSGSIYGAILSHAGFNLAMTYFIFYYIL